MFAFACLFVLWLFIVSRVGTGLERGDLRAAWSPQYYSNTFPPDLRAAWWKGVRIELRCSAGWRHDKSANNSSIPLFASKILAQKARNNARISAKRLELA